SKSCFNRALKSCLGKSRNSAAMRTSGSASFLPRGTGARGFRTIPSTASLSCSIKLRLGIPATWLSAKLHPQALQSPELQLFHRTFGPPQRLGDLADSFLLRKSHCDHAPLILGKLIDQTKQPRPLLDLLQIAARNRIVAYFRRIVHRHFPSGSLGAIGNRVS